MASAARLAAYTALRSVDSGQQTLGDALARTRHRLEDPRDRSLAADIALGTLRWRALLDHLTWWAGALKAAR